MSRIPSYPYSIDEDDSVFSSPGDLLRRGVGGPETPRPRGSERSARLSSSNRRDCLPPTRTGQLRPGDDSPKVDPLRLVKAENNPLAGEALETMIALERQKQAQKEIRKMPSILDESSDDVDWEQNLSSWKHRRKSSYQPKALDMEEEEREKASPSGGGKRSKTFKELMEEKDKRSNGHGFYTYESENSPGLSRDASFDSVEAPVTKTTTTMMMTSAAVSSTRGRELASKTAFSSPSDPPRPPPSISEASRSSSNAKEREFHVNTSLIDGHRFTGEDRTNRSTPSTYSTTSTARSSQEKPHEIRLDAQKQTALAAPGPKVVLQRTTAIESAHSFDTGRDADKKPWRSTDRQTSELTSSSLTTSSFGVKPRDKPGGGAAQPRPSYSYGLGGSGSTLRAQKTDATKPTTARLQVAPRTTTTTTTTTRSVLVDRPSSRPAPLLAGLSTERRAKSNWELNFAGGGGGSGGGKSDLPEFRTQQKLLAGVPSSDKFKKTLSLFQTKEAESGQPPPPPPPAKTTVTTIKRSIGRVFVETATKPVRAAGVETRSTTNLSRNDYLTTDSSARLRGLSRSVQGLDGYRLDVAKPDRWNDAAKPDRWSASYDRYLNDRQDARREDKKKEASTPPSGAEKALSSTVSLVDVRTSRDETNVDRITPSVKSADGISSGLEAEVRREKPLVEMKIDVNQGEISGVGSTISWTLKIDQDPIATSRIRAGVSYDEKQTSRSEEDAAQKHVSGIVQPHQNILETGLSRDDSGGEGRSRLSRYGDTSDWRMDKRKDSLDNKSPPKYRADDESSVKDGGRGQTTVADDRTTIRAENPPETKYKYGQVEGVKPPSSYLSDLRASQNSDSYKTEATASSRRPAIDAADMAKSSLTTKELSKTTVTESRTSVPLTRTTVTESRTSVPLTRTTVTESRTSVPLTRTTVTESRTSVPLTRTTVTESRTSVPLTRTTVTERFSSDLNSSSHQRDKLTQRPSISDIFSRRSAAAVCGSSSSSRSAVDDDDDDGGGGETTLAQIVTSRLDTGRNEFAHRTTANDDDGRRKFDREFQDGGKLATRYDVTGGSHDNEESNGRRYGLQRNSYALEDSVDGGRREDRKHAVGSHDISTAPKHNNDDRRRQELEFQVNFSSSRFDQKSDRKTSETDQDKYVVVKKTDAKGGRIDNLLLLEPLELKIDANRKSSSESPEKFGRKNDEPQTQRRHAAAMPTGDGSKDTKSHHEDSYYADEKLKSLASDMKKSVGLHTSNDNDSIYLNRASKEILTLDFLEAGEIEFLPTDKQRHEDGVSRDIVLSLHKKEEQQRRSTTERSPPHKQRSPSPNQSPPFSPVRRSPSLPPPPSTDPPPLPVARPPSSPLDRSPPPPPLLLPQTERSRPPVEPVRSGDRLIDFDDYDVCDGVTLDRNSNITSDRTSSTFSRSTNGHQYDKSHDEKVPEIRTKETHVKSELANGHDVHLPKSAHSSNNISEPAKTKSKPPAEEKNSDDFSFLPNTQLLDTSANRDKCRLTKNGPMSARQRPKTAPFITSLDPTDLFNLSDGDQSNSEIGEINGNEHEGLSGDLSARKTEEAAAGSSLRPNASLKDGDYIGTKLTASSSSPLSGGHRGSGTAAGIEPPEEVTRRPRDNVKTPGLIGELNVSSTSRFRDDSPKSSSDKKREDTEKKTISPIADVPTANLLDFAAAAAAASDDDDDDDDNDDVKDDGGPPPPPLPNAPPPFPSWNSFPDGSAGLPPPGPPPGPPSGPPPPLIDFDSYGEEDA